MSTSIRNKEIFQQYKAGTAPEVLANTYGLSKARIMGILSEQRNIEAANELTEARKSTDPLFYNNEDLDNEANRFAATYGWPDIQSGTPKQIAFAKRARLQLVVDTLNILYSNQLILAGYTKDEYAGYLLYLIQEKRDHRYWIDSLMEEREKFIRAVYDFSHGIDRVFASDR